MARTKKSFNPRDFTKKKDEDILVVIQEDFKRAETYQRPFFDKFADFYKQYSCIHDGLRPDGSNLFIPYIYNIIETALPKLLSSIFESHPFITYKPVGMDDAHKGEAMTNLVYFQMKQKMKATTRLYEVFKSAIMYGTAFSKQTWKYEEKEVIERQMVDEEVEMEDGNLVTVPIRKPTPTKKVTYDAPVIRNIPLEALYFDPGYQDLDDSPFVIHEYFMELHELKAGQREGYYKNVDKVSDSPQDGPLKERYDSVGTVMGNMKDGVKIWEYWTDYWLVTVANGDTVIRVEPNPYYHKKKPFVKWVALAMPNEPYGKSMIETLVDLQSELNTLRNQRIDNVSLALNRMFLIAKGSGIDVDQLKSRPNGWIEVDDVSKDIKELEVKDITSAAYRDEEIVKTDMDVTSGVHNMDRGQPTDRRETATVASLMSSASSERFKLQVLMLCEDPMTELGWQLAELNKQFLEDETFILITGDDGKTGRARVEFGEINTDFDVIPTSSATDAAVNKEVRRGQLIQMMNVALNNPVVNQAGFLKEIFKEFEFKNLDELIQETPPPPPPGDDGGVPTDDAGGLYPQQGGVGAMAQYLQNPNL